MNLLSFFVRITQPDALIRILQEYTGVVATKTGKLHIDQIPLVLKQNDQPPTCYKVFQQNSWVVVEVNSFKKLHELGTMISSILQTSVLQIIQCEVAEYAYWLLIEQGKVIREIESKGHQLLPDLDIGERLPFEELILMYFDVDTLIHYCQELNIDLINLYPDEATCFVLELPQKNDLVPMDDWVAIQQILSGNA